ncbi:hypothetical protein CDG77_02925 [Nostoc sp. 'Peltigera membranacea cyanobiont' 213]|nr:hypothetical protein CDG77_02925 [Nostoc sp. 'Peltigera membranacea cyanobiont' 213]
MFEKSLVMYQILLDPPKSPDKLGDFDSVSPLFKGSQRGLGGFPMSDWRGLGGINKCLISQPTTFQTTSKLISQYSSVKRSVFFLLFVYSMSLWFVKN